jgi:two-component system, response regulator PdtaR
MAGVLICEDEPLLALDLADAVVAAGFEVCGVYARGVEAIRAAQQIKPDLALIDMALADGRTGAEVAQALAKLGARIVIISGSDERAALGAIAHTFIAKPFPPMLAQQVLGGMSG